MEQFILGGIVIVAVTARLVLRLRDKRALARTLAQDAEQLQAEMARRDARDAAARAQQLKLTKLEIGAHIDCLGKMYEVTSYATIVDPQAPYSPVHIRYLLNDEAGNTRLLTVLVRTELEYHCVSLWQEVPFDGPYPTGEGQNITVNGHQFMRPHYSGASFHYPPCTYQEDPGTPVNYWEYYHEGIDCECGASVDLDELRIDQLPDGQWVASMGRDLSLTDVVVFDA